MHATDHLSARGPVIRAFALWALCAATAHAAEPADVPEWLITSDGAYVVHMTAGTAWKRCLEGMQWNGKRCDGQPLMLSHTDALALARSRSKADGVTWRLPSAKELQRLAQRNSRTTRTTSPLLPVGSDEWCWSSTTPVDTSRINEYSYGNIMRGVNDHNMARLQFLHAWAVDMNTADARSDTPRRDRLHVRLVRSVD